MAAALASDRRGWLRCMGVAAAGSALGWGESAQAQSAAGTEPLRVAACLPLTGELATQGQAVALGAQAALAGASVKGRPVALQLVDDAGRPAEALRQVQALAADPRVLGLLGLWGADANEAVLPVLETARLPLVGPVTGSERLRAQASRWCFPLRAGLADEAARLISQLDHQGLNDMAVVHTDDSFGQDALAALQLEMNRAVMRPVCLTSLVADGRNTDAVMTQVATSQAQAVIVAAPPAAAAQFIRRWTAKGFKASVAVLADTGAGLPALLGEAGRGVAVSQVWPSPWRPAKPLVRDYQAAMRAAQPKLTDPQASFGYASFEGYLNAWVLLKALLRGGGREPSREALLAGLEGLELDLDGIPLKLNAKPPRRGVRFSEMTVLTADGVFRR